ncbi:MAG: hypothetical protein HY701_04580 [Gemmatimonadetes bacterium]|nr:hypothetical protein [Gemmatimonadota bacterium]
MGVAPPASLTDFHSHLVPDVDDGVRDLAEALRALERMVGLGITTIVTTPHIKASLTLNQDALTSRLAEVEAAWEPVVRAAADRFPELWLGLGQEVMLDVPDARFVDVRLRLAGTAFALVEWPRFMIPPGTIGVLSRLAAAGVKPIIAHAERYLGIDERPELVADWRRAGAYAQVNYGGLAGQWGPRVQRAAIRLLERGLVDYFSADYHGDASPDLYLEEARGFLEAHDASDVWLTLAATNPARILEGEEPLPLAPLKLPRSAWARIRSFFSSSLP